jgi:glycosyltransferase involved in cell wall biosynthesis
VEQLRRKARERVRTEYSWEAITDRYEELFRWLVKGSLP